jgi:urea transporter
MKNTYLQNLAVAYLKGYGQILLQPDHRSGILVLAGIFWGSPAEGISALVGGVIGLGTAKACRFPPDKIAQGLYGFNAALVSVALTHFFGINPLVAPLLFLGTLLATLLTHLGFISKIPPYTLPFIFITWSFCHFSSSLALVPHLDVSTPLVPHLDVSTPLVPHLDALTRLVLSIPLGLAQVVLQGNVVSGLLFFLAILVHSRLSALFALGGALLSTLIAFLAVIPERDIYNGTYGYCAILCALAWTGNNRHQIQYAILGALLSCLMMWLLLQLGILPLTAPFVASTWVLLLVSYTNQTQNRISHVHKL